MALPTDFSNTFSKDSGGLSDAISARAITVAIVAVVAIISINPNKKTRTWIHARAIGSGMGARPGGIWDSISEIGGGIPGGPR